jgi:hypothetical protein
MLLAINAGMGNNDVAQMPIGALDLAGGWRNYPRPKTGVRRTRPPSFRKRQGGARPHYLPHFTGLAFHPAQVPA